MAQNSEPDYTAKLSEQIEDAQRQALPYLQAAQQFVEEARATDDVRQQALSIIRAVQQFVDEASAAMEAAREYVEEARAAEQGRQQILPILRSAQQFVEEADATKASAAPLLAVVHQVALAMDAGIREVFAAVQNAGEQTVYGAGGVIIGKPTYVAAGDVAAASETAYVVRLADSGQAIDKLATKATRDGIAGLSPVQVLTLVLIWIFLVGGPVAQDALPLDVQSVLTNEYGTLGIALAVTFWILANRDR